MSKGWFRVIILMMIVISVITGYGEALRIKDNAGYSYLWHWLQFIERAGILFIGIFIGRWYTERIGLQIIAVLIINFAVIFFTIYDGIINIVANNKWFFYTSKTSMAFTEQYATWYVKTILLLIVIIFNYIIEKRLKKI